MSREQVLESAGRAVARAKALHVATSSSRREDATRTDIDYMAQVVRVGDRGGRHHHQHPRHGRLHGAEEYVEILRGLRERVPELRRRDPVGALPQRPGAGGRQLAGRRDGGRAAGRVHDQRHRRARRQRLAGGDRDVLRTCKPLLRRSTPASTPPRSAQPLVSRAHRLRRCSPTRRSSAATRSPTRPASTSTAC